MSIKEHLEPEPEELQQPKERHDAPLIASSNAAAASKAEKARAERAKEALAAEQAATAKASADADKASADKAAEEAAVAKEAEAELAAVDIAAGKTVAAKDSPRRFTGQFDHSQDAENHFQDLLPHVTKSVNDALATNGHSDIEVTEAEISANFLAEDGFDILRQPITDDVDGFEFLSIENIADELDEVRDWLLPGVLEYGKHPERLAEQVEKARESGDEDLVRSLKYITLELGLYANAGVYAQRKAMASDAIAKAGGDYSQLPEHGQLYWTRMFFKLEPRDALAHLQKLGIRAYDPRMPGAPPEPPPAQEE